MSQVLVIPSQVSKALDLSISMGEFYRIQDSPAMNNRNSARGLEKGLQVKLHLEETEAGV